jgi:hypothetical protein
LPQFLYGLFHFGTITFCTTTTYAPPSSTIKKPAAASYCGMPAHPTAHLRPPQPPISNKYFAFKQNPPNPLVPASPHYLAATIPATYQPDGPPKGTA